ncbi:MAG: NmrA family NAD(P)-binding protein, partial [Solirubrobacterales bacterium]
DGAGPDSPVPLFRAKWEVEEAIRAAGIPHTILAPTYLMENLFNPWNLPALHAGVLPSPISVGRPLQQTAVADLLSLAALAIERPDDFADRRIPVASDELTGEDSAAAISEVIPRTLEPRQSPAEALPPGVRLLFAWLESAGHQVDIDELRDGFPQVGWHRYGAWARTQLDRFRELCAHPEPVAG